LSISRKIFDVVCMAWRLDQLISYRSHLYATRTLE
jgi:hypothetical protein